MNEHRVHHATITLDRTCGHPPATVFRAWADPARTQRSFADDDGWHHSRDELDVREDGLAHVLDALGGRLDHEVAR